MLEGIVSYQFTQTFGIFLYLCNSKIIAILTDKIKPEKYDAYPVQLR